MDFVVVVVLCKNIFHCFVFHEKITIINDSCGTTFYMMRNYFDKIDWPMSILKWRNENFSFLKNEMGGRVRVCVGGRVGRRQTNHKNLLPNEEFFFRLQSKMGNKTNFIRR